MKAIAVISPCEPAFKNWVRNNGIEGFEYKRIHNTVELSGCQFISIVETPHSSLVKPSIIEATYLRLK